MSAIAKSQSPIAEPPTWDPAWHNAGLCLARPGDWAGPLRAELDGETIRVRDFQGNLVLVVGATPVQVFAHTGNPPGLMKGPND